jgi:hypothetical protein
MGSDFRASLSSFGAGVESGFDAIFGSGFSAFGFTMDVLLFLLLVPGADPEVAWKLVGQALKKAQLEPVEFSKWAATCLRKST